MKINILKRIICAALTPAMLLCAVSCFGGKNDDVPAGEGVSTVRVTFPEGLTAYEIAGLLEENGVCSAADFLAAVNEPDGTYSTDIDNPDERPFLLEGYVFPDTYDFYTGESAETALGRFLSNMESKFTSERAQRADELGMSMDEALTLASIIQEETSIPSEMPKVSSVLHNRLDSDIDYMNRLQCDATIFYLDNSVEPAIPGGAEKYKPYYNTYKFAGLPAGPICSPGVAAIDAALYPADTDYLFFVSDSENNYYYSETYEQHMEYCERIGIQ